MEPRRKLLMKRHIVFQCCLVMLALLLGSAVQAAETTTILTGKVRNTVTRSPIVHFRGVVDRVLVAPGDKVQKGQPLMRYVLQDEARRALQREINLGPGTEASKGQILDLQSQLSQVSAQRNKAKSLAATGLGSNKAFGRLEADVHALQTRISLLEESIAKQEANFALRMEELSGYFDTEIKEGMALPPYLFLKSPIDGYVLSISQTMNPGAMFDEGFTPVTIGQMDPMAIQVPVYEAEVSSLSVGDEATVEIPSLGNKTFKATISEIAWASNDMDVSRASYFNVELIIPNPDLELKPGFKAVVRFTLK